MRRSSMILGIVILAAIGASLIYLVVTMERASSQHLCWVCSRPLHERSSIVALLGGKREIFCCPSCALAAHRQTGKVTKVLKLTDYDTDSELDPQDAYFVRGSNVNLCTRHHPLVDSAKQTYAVQYDRCSPACWLLPAGRQRKLLPRNKGAQYFRSTNTPLNSGNSSAHAGALCAVLSIPLRLPFDRRGFLVRESVRKRA